MQLYLKLRNTINYYKRSIGKSKNIKIRISAVDFPKYVE